MSVHQLRVVPRAGAPQPARLSTFAKALKRLRPEIRDGVAQLARRHVRLAELAQSFPALLVALAWPRHGFDARPVIRGVIAGVPLALLAEQAGVPLWLRKMKAEMLIAPLPPLPDSPFVRHRIVNHFPGHARYADHWLRGVSDAGRWAHEGFALWCAQIMAGKEVLYNFRLLCLWAWFSGQAGTRGHALIAQPWTPDIKLKAATAAAKAWRERLDLEFSLGDRQVDDVWFAPGEVDGYAFLPLRNAAEIDAEAEAMRNCLRTYGENLAQDFSRLWSVRKDGARLATLETARLGDSPFPYIRQLKLAGNANAPAELWLATNRWLQAQEPHLFTGPVIHWPSVRPQRAAWLATWKPYWLAMGRVPDWLPLNPTRDTLYDL